MREGRFFALLKVLSDDGGGSSLPADQLMLDKGMEWRRQRIDKERKDSVGHSDDGMRKRCLVHFDVLMIRIAV